jgi:hypothetical protein
MEEGSQVTCASEGWLLDPYLALSDEVGEPVAEEFEFFPAWVLVDRDDEVMEAEFAVDSGGVEAADSKVYPPHTQVVTSVMGGSKSHLCD